MTSPLFTVVVLTVLWLIVVVPMIVRRNDDVAKDREVSRFGSAMRALGRRSSASTRRDAATRRDADDTETAGWVQPRINGPRSEVFVHGSDDLTPAVRRPVPAAREALMYPTDRSEMSDARRQMMARRRRSLAILGVGSFITLLGGVVAGGIVWVFTALFLAGLAGYLLFLRAQALKDRDRRASRLERSTSRQPSGYEITDEDDLAPEAPTMVRIDDDDMALHNLDTVDLTGLYAAEDGRREELTAFTARRAG